MFIDQVKIKVKSGNGGNGAVAWRREKFVPKGGPAGGDGGKGGDVFLEADNRLSTLLEFKYKSVFQADSGENGRSKNCHGHNAKDITIKVPVGTIVKDTKTNQIIADLVEEGQKILIAAGGKGGRGNARFATPTRQAPQFCEPGEPGIARDLELELKLLADIGIIGLPNVGKSTFISVVSAAKPKIADYPFTTLVPNLGVVKTPDGQGIVLADIPGLIEGASTGAGLGHLFLRHVERTRLLIHIIDSTDEDPVQNYNIIRSELEKYSDRLANLEEIIVLNKIDIATEEKIKAILETISLKNKRTFTMSAATTVGTKEVINYVLERIQEIPKPEPVVYTTEDSAATDHDDSEYSVYKEDGVFFVVGGKVSRLISVTNLENNEALFRLQNILRSMGVFEALQKAGAQDNDLVIIDKFEFEYFEDY